jgi:chromosome segregation ATPase
MIIEDMKHGSPDMKKPDIAQSIDVLWAQIRLYADAYSALKTAHGEMQQQLLSADKLRLVKEKEQERVLQEQKVLSDRVKALERSLHQSAGLQQEYDVLKTELQSIKRNATKHDEELAIRQGQISILEGKLADLSGMDNAMRTILSGILKESLDMSEFPQNEDDLRKASEAILKHMRGLRIEAQDRLEEIEQLRSEMKNVSEVKHSKDSNIESLLREIEDLKTENKDLLRSMKQSEKTTESHIEYNDSDLHAEVKDLKLQLELKISDIEIISNRLREAEDQLDEEKDRNRDLKDQIIALRDLNPDAAGRQSSLESSVEKLRQERSDLQSEIEKLRTEQDEKDDIISALRTAKGDLFDEAGFTALKKENSALKNERLIMAEKFEELKQRLDKALNA